MQRQLMPRDVDAGAAAGTRRIPRTLTHRGPTATLRIRVATRRATAADAGAGRIITRCL